jgi:hypothetical protein
MNTSSNSVRAKKDLAFVGYTFKRWSTLRKVL